MKLTEKQKRIIGTILLLISIITMIGWMFELYYIPIPGAIFWTILALGIVFFIPSKKKRKEENKK